MKSRKLHSTLVRVLVMLAILLTCRQINCAENTAEDSAVYFNAGTEKYLQGRFSEAVENLQKAQELDKKNLKIQELIVKILIEAATQNHLSRNYRQAFEYIKKAKTIAPDNPKVQEIYALTYDMISPSKEKLVLDEKPAVQTIVEHTEKPQASAKPKKNAVPAQPKNTADYTYEKPMPPAAGYGVPPQKTFIEKYSTYIAILAAASGFIALIFAVFLKLNSGALRGARLKLSELEKNITELNGNNTKTTIELEKTKESLKYEHQTAEQYRRELKEKDNRQEERLKMELDLRTKQIEEKFRADAASQHKKKDSQQEAFLHQQQAKFLEYLGDSSTNEDISSPVLDSARERIAAMAENLYEYAPGAAHDFLDKMAANQNPLIRANVVQALARIARPETIETLFKLYNDADARVKREVLKHFKQLLQKSSANAVKLPNNTEEQMRAALAEERQKGDWIL